jgi:hypothetical protein
MLSQMRYLCAVAILLVVAATAIAHSGRTDSRGGHFNRKTGSYHFHGAPRTPTVRVRTAPRTSALTQPRTRARTTNDRAAKVAPQIRKPNPQKEAQSELDSALLALKAIVSKYEGTAAANRAKAILVCSNELEAIASKEGNEKAASAKLRLAKALIKKGQMQSGRKWLKDIVEKYPGTRAANEASRLSGGL